MVFPILIGKYFAESAASARRWSGRDAVAKTYLLRNIDNVINSYIIFLMTKKIFALIFLFTFLASPASASNELAERAEFLRKEINRLRPVLFNLYLQRDVSAEAYSVVNLSNSTVLSEKNADEGHIIASVTKMMSAIITKENVDMEEEIILETKMLTPYTRISPSLTMGLKVSTENLLKAMLIQSTNYAAEALTYFLNEGEFLKLMNEKAKEIGMENTHFEDAHGLSVMNRSTTKDLAVLLDYVFKNHPDLLEITKDNNFQMPCGEKICTFKNLNIFSEHINFIGGKTGYLHASKETFACIFNFNGDAIAIVILYSDNRKENTETILDYMERIFNPPL